MWPCRIRSKQLVMSNNAIAGKIHEENVLNVTGHVTVNVSVAIGITFLLTKVPTSYRSNIWFPPMPLVVLTFSIAKVK